MGSKKGQAVIRLGGPDGARLNPRPRRHRRCPKGQATPTAKGTGNRQAVSTPEPDRRDRHWRFRRRDRLFKFGPTWVSGVAGRSGRAPKGTGCSDWARKGQALFNSENAKLGWKLDRGPRSPPYHFDPSPKGQTVWNYRLFGTRPRSSPRAMAAVTIVRSAGGFLGPFLTLCSSSGMRWSLLPSRGNSGPSQPERGRRFRRSVWADGPRTRTLSFEPEPPDGSPPHCSFR